MKITLNLKDQTVTLSNVQLQMTLEESGIILDDCENLQDIEGQVNDWANDREIQSYEIEIIEGGISFIANTGDKVLSGKTWYNDEIKRTSQLINSADVSEICGTFIGKFNTLQELNDECYGFSFSEEAKY